MSAARAAFLIALTAGLALPAAGCGGSPGSHVARLDPATTTAQGGSTPTGSAGPAQRNPLASALAYSRCMRSHGVPAFPDPDGQGNFPPLNQRALGVSKQTSVAADEVCRHLLQSGGGTAGPQQQQQKLAFALRVAACMRTRGYPSYPDPASSGQALPPGIDPSSPRFQAAQTACEGRARHVLGLP